MKDLKKDGDAEKSNIEKEMAAMKRDMVQTAAAKSEERVDDTNVIPPDIVAQMKKVFEEPKDKIVAETKVQVPLAKQRIRTKYAGDTKTIERKEREVDKKATKLVEGAIGSWKRYKKVEAAAL